MAYLLGPVSVWILAAGLLHASHASCKNNNDGSNTVEFNLPRRLCASANSASSFQTPHAYIRHESAPSLNNAPGANFASSIAHLFYATREMLALEVPYARSVAVTLSCSSTCLATSESRFRKMTDRGGGVDPERSSRSGHRRCLGMLGPTYLFGLV